MSQLGDLLREPTERTGSGRAEILGSVDDRTDGGDRPRTRWKMLKRRLRFTGVCCCGGRLRSFRQTTIAVEDEETTMTTELGQNRVVVGLGPDQYQDPDCLTVAPGVTNLAEALAAERYARGESVGATQPQMPLMRLLAEADGCDGTWFGNDPVCCVCMVREKGAAFIPCGHTFCRVCSRDIWMNRGTCAVCNRPICDVLDLY